MELRYASDGFDLRQGLLKFSASLQGREVVILKDNINLCAKVLSVSDVKGNFIEQLIATPAWAPILSVESTDHTVWKNLIKEFRPLFAKLNWEENLPKILKEFNQKEFEKVDAEVISRETLRIFFKLVFNEDPGIYEELFYKASLEWRKEVALKGKGDHRIKNEFWHQLKSLVKRKFGSDDVYLVSAIAQPFIISPQINFADILSGVGQIFEDSPSIKEEALKGDSTYLKHVVFESMRLYHPFPILERELTKDLAFENKTYKKGTQFFMLLDEFKQSRIASPRDWENNHPFAPLLFGVGRRSCPGRQLAEKLMPIMLKKFLTVKYFHPKENLLYSGRVNDKTVTVKETLYQLKKMSSLLTKSALVRFE